MYDIEGTPYKTYTLTSDKLMKRFLYFLVAYLVSFGAYGQNISVASFRLAETDLTANQAGTIVYDQNGEKCALIRIQTTQTGFAFDVGSLGVMKTEYKTAEVWVYVPFGVRRITIRHQLLGSTTYDFMIPIQKARTYIMELTTGEVQTIVRQAVTSQYVLFRLNPSNATVELDGEVVENIDGTATIRKPFGSYSYRVQAPRYAPEVGNITVEDPKNKHVVTVNLVPQFSTFTFTAPNNSDIYINDKLEGKGRCEVELSYGVYMVEARLASHRSSTREIEITKDSPKSISLSSPTPIYGSIDINSSPADATIYIDGKHVGTTPMYIDQYLVGTHEVSVKKSGYKELKKSIAIEENQTATFSGALEKGFSSDRRTYTVNGVTFEMIPVEGGTFTMGATSEQGSDYDNDEKPTHQVTLSDFSIGKTEVTQALWEAVMGSNPSRFEGDNLPVEKVSWDDCQEFIRKLNTLTGGNFRLPTEAEWEYAARGGNKSKGYKYSGSNNVGQVAWYRDNSNNQTHPVATKSPNELGIYDMSGNVYEWCQDWYGSYSSGAQTNPKGPSTGTHRVGRGGSWINSARYTRVSIRFHYTPSITLGNLGLRLVSPSL